MAKTIILYNLAENVSDEEYKDYVINEKGPLLDSLASAKKIEIVKITGSESGEVPYKYVGIMHLNTLAEFYRKDVASKKFQGFLEKWRPMVVNPYILFGEEIY